MKAIILLFFIIVCFLENTNQTSTAYGPTGTPSPTTLDFWEVGFDDFEELFDQTYDNVCIVPCSNFPRLKDCDSVFFSGISNSLQPRVIVNTYNAIQNDQKIGLCQPKSAASVKKDMTPNLVTAAYASYKLFWEICKKICKKEAPVPFQRVSVPRGSNLTVGLTKKGLIAVNGVVSVAVNPSTGKVAPAPVKPVIPVPKRSIR